MSEIDQLTETELTPLVNEALKNCRSVLALSRSPLANSALVTPALVRDSASPTAEERAHGLRLMLQWAVNRLAPSPSAQPFGEHRPFDDPTWRDSRWWRYNILRHRYLEPLHPDDFVADGRFTETLIALTGIPSADTFFAERNRAIREVARWLHRQLRDGEADMAVQQLAVQEVYSPLKREPDAHQLFSLASTFAHIFPRRLLLTLAKAEGIPNPGPSLYLLVSQRYLLSGDDDVNLWLSPVLRAYGYAQQSTDVAKSRHERIARDYARVEGKSQAAGTEAPLLAAYHFLAANRAAIAAGILLAAADELVEELEIEELRAMLQRFRPGQLANDLAHKVQLLLADLHRMAGDHDAAVTACRAALKSATERQQQGQAYRRLGKLYEQRNQHHALNYYRQAIARFDASDPALAELLKDRGWLYILRRDWANADADLTAALRYAVDGKQTMVADIYDALAGLHRRQQAYTRAVEYARAALALREEGGNPLHVAKSLGNLGLIYQDQKDYANSIAAHEEAAVTYRKLNNRELMLAAMLNIGSVRHLAGQLSEAINIYRACIDIGVEIEHVWVQIMAHSNLAEAHAQLGEEEAARQHWRTGHALSRQHGFDDQLTYFAELQTQFPALQTIDIEAMQKTSPAPKATSMTIRFDRTALGELDPDERVAWELVQQHSYITAKLLMENAVISKATATRKLANMVARGGLRKVGKGRGTRYIANAGSPRPESTAPAEAQTPFLHLQQQLGRHQATLTQQYNLAGLGVIDPALRTRAIIPGALNMVARFGQLPDVLAFFDLENYLSEVSGQPANLLLEAAMQREEQIAVTKETMWIWG